MVGALLGKDQAALAHEAMGPPGDGMSSGLVRPGPASAWACFSLTVRTVVVPPTVRNDRLPREVGPWRGVKALIRATWGSGSRHIGPRSVSTRFLQPVRPPRGSGSWPRLSSYGWQMREEVDACLLKFSTSNVFSGEQRFAAWPAHWRNVGWRDFVTCRLGLKSSIPESVCSLKELPWNSLLCKTMLQWRTLTTNFHFSLKGCGELV